MHKIKILKRAGILPALVFIFFCGCKPLPDVQGTGHSFLQGSWTEDTSLLKTDSLRKNQTLYSFRFTCDSVYLIMKSKALIHYEDDHCYLNDTYEEYGKGVYQVIRDSLIIAGVYTHSNFKMKVAGCFRNGNFNSVYTIQSDTLTDLIKLRNTEAHGPIFLRKTKHCTCVPQPTGRR